MVKISVNKLDYDSDIEVQRTKVKTKAKIRKMRPNKGK